jgi:TP901 family phage tail tape measure protein
MAYTIPAIFKAIDKMSAPLRKMELATMSLADRANYNMYRAERAFNKAGEAAFATGRKTGAAGIAMAIPLGLAAKAAVDFEAKMGNVSTLLDTNAEDMGKMGEQVLSLSKKLPVSIDDLTTSLYDIRSAGIPANVAMQTLEQSAILATAGLSTSSEATNIMTSAMNAFASEGKSAAQINDILFKTVKYGKTTIAQLSQAFGATAPVVQSAGVKLADFQAATAALTTVGTPATQAQNMLRQAVVSLIKPTTEMDKVFKKLGVKTGQELIEKTGGLGGAFEAVSKTAKELNLNFGKTVGSVEAMGAMVSITGATNKAYVDTLNDMEKGTNAVSLAFDKQAQTGKAQMQLAKNNFEALSITIGTTLIPIINSLIQSATPVIEKFTAWVSANKPLVSTIAKLAVGLTGAMFVISGLSFAFGALTKTIYLAKGVMALYNIGLGITNALQGASAFTVMGNTVAYKAYRATVVVTTYAQKALNMAMTASPIGVMIAGIAALSLAAYGLYKAFSKVSTEQQVMNEIQERALEKSIDQRVEVTSLFIALKNAEKGTSAYNDILKKIDAIQPGIVDKYKLQEKSLYAIAEAEKELTKNIMKRAEEEARAELLKEAIREKIRLQTEGPTTFQKLTGLFNEDATKALQQADIAEQESRINVLTKMMYGSGMQPTKDIVSPATDNQAALSQMIEKENNANVTIGFENAPEGMTVKTDNKSVTPNLQTTASRRNK